MVYWIGLGFFAVLFCVVLLAWWLNQLNIAFDDLSKNYSGSRDSHGRRIVSLESFVQPLTAAQNQLASAQNSLVERFQAIENEIEESLEMRLFILTEQVNDGPIRTFAVVAKTATQAGQLLGEQFGVSPDSLSFSQGLYIFRSFSWEITHQNRFGAWFLSPTDAKESARVNRNANAGIMQDT